jgi:ferric-dicitrate binding protein FerR (iron transport regulator)
MTPEKQAAYKQALEISAQHWDLLAQACEGWLSPEEGNKNMIKAYRERKKTERRQKWKKLLGIRV